MMHSGNYKDDWDAGCLWGRDLGYSEPQIMESPREV